MTRATKVHHATVLVGDLETAFEFYSGVLGLETLPRPDLPSNGIWYEVAGVQIHLIQGTSLEPASARHIAFVVDDLEAILERVRRLGLPIWNDLPIAGFDRCHCRDPFGNGIELLQALTNEDSATESPADTRDLFVGEDGKWQTT